MQNHDISWCIVDYFHCLSQYTSVQHCCCCAARMHSRQ